MKKVLLKGTGQDRVEKQDELKYKYSIISDENLILSQEYPDPVPINDVIEQEGGMPNTVWKILKTMKQGEKIECKITSEAFQQDEKDYFKQNLTNINQENILIKIEI